MGWGHAPAAGVDADAGGTKAKRATLPRYTTLREAVEKVIASAGSRVDFSNLEVRHPLPRLTLSEKSPELDRFVNFRC